MPPRILPRLPSQFLLTRSPVHTRHFINLAGGTAPLRFSETRTFPYPPGPLYTIVSDINSYHKFLPYCLGSTVTKYDTDSLPTEADLRVGWGAYDETFRSKVLCEPEKLVVRADASQNEMFQALKTRWEIRSREDKGSDVSLHIEFQFKNPVYAALSGAVAPKIVGIMVAAFEGRAKEVLGEGKEKEKELEEQTAVSGEGN